MAEKAKTTENASVLDETPTHIEAQGNIPIGTLISCGMEISDAILEEWNETEGGKRIERGQVIRIEKYIADRLMKETTPGVKPRMIRKRVPAFIPATNY